MVDINLFKEDDEEKEDWETTSGEGEELDDELKEEESGSEGDIQEPVSLEEDLLDNDEEAIPDIQELQDKEQEEDYEFGVDREKKTPVWLWVFLGIVVVGVLAYLFVIQPRQARMKQATQQSSERQLTAETRTQEIQENESGQGVVADSEVGSQVDSAVSTPSVDLTDRVTLMEVGSVSAFVDAAGVVFENLTREGQLGTIVLEGNQFHVGYVSETPNVANAMGHRIRTLLGASSIQTSPEDRHRTGGRIRYWGVISGKLPQKTRGTNQTAVKPFATTESFLEGIQRLVRQHQLSIKQTEKFAERTEEGVRRIPVRLKIEGSKRQVISFLGSLKGYQGNYGLEKLTLAPVSISDFYASQVKIVLDFIVYIT